jgi:EAL domain-containing protein (putative c-di-GMP-specific phosphodiesterase class I)
MGFGDKVSIETIVQFKIFKIDKEFVDQMKAAGYNDLSTDELVQFRIFKVDKSFIDKATKFVGSRPSAEQLIQLKVAEGNH